MIKILKTQVCIVGSGPAGTFSSEILLKNGIDVTLVEEGNQLENINLDSFLDKTNISQNFSYDYGFSKQIGGSSNLWSGRLAILEYKDINFENKEFTSWPITYEELTHYYKLASSKLNINFEQIWSKKDVTEENIPSFFKDKKFSDFEFKKFIWKKPIFNCKDYLKNYQLKFNNFTLISNTKVLRLFQNNLDGRINYLEAKTKNNDTVKIESQFFIIANGGIEAPRLLLNSNSNSDLGIGNFHNMVGKCLMTHPKANIGLMSLNKSIKINNPIFNESSKKSFLRYGIGFKSTNNLLNHYLQFTPYYNHDFLNPLNLLINKKNINEHLPEYQFTLKNNIKNLKLLLRNKLFTSGSIEKESREFIIRAYLDQYPEINNKIYLSNKKDMHGIQKVSIDWNYSLKDKDDFLRFFNYFSDFIIKNKLGNIHFVENWNLKGIHSHFIGTTRMGNNPKNSVVNSNCKVHDVPNLFIAGPSVFPTGGHANPFLTIIALSLRLSEYLTKLVLDKK